MKRHWYLGAFGLAFFVGIGCSSDDSSGNTPVDSAVGDVVTETGGETAVPETGGDSTTDTMTDTPVGAPKGTMDVQILSLSDWHGQLKPVSDKDAAGNSLRFGGVAVLSAYFQKERAANPNTLLFTSGDEFGATEALSSFFGDTPAVEALTLLKLDADTFGNHNFDSGTTHLKELIDHSTNAWITSNLVDTAGELGTKVTKGFKIFSLGGTDPTKQVNVGVIGITSPDAPSLVFPGKMGSVTIKEPVAAAKKAAADAKAAGANFVVCLVHMGGTGKDATGAPTGPLLDFAKGLTDVDLVLGDHTDVIVNTKIGDVTILENRSKGRTYGKTLVHVKEGKLTGIEANVVDPVFDNVAFLGAPPACSKNADCDATKTSGKCSCTKDSTTGDCATGKTGTCTLVCPGTACPDASYTCNTTGAVAGTCSKTVMAPDSAGLTLLQPYIDKLAVEFDKKVTTVSASFPRDGAIERVQEVAIGDLLADAILAKYKVAPINAQIAFTNGGGIRDHLPSNYAPKDLTLHRPVAGYVNSPPYDIVIGDIYGVLPFGNACVVRQLTGKTIWTMLEYDVFQEPAIDGRFLQIAGMKFTYKLSAAKGARVQSVTLDDASSTPIPNDDTKSYVVVTNDFTNAGGDGYTMLKEAIPSAPREIMADVFLEYIKGLAAPIDPVIQGRITQNP